jgi:hypothetical protein
MKLERWGNLGRAKSQDSGPSVGPVGISYRHNSPNHSPSARARSACPIPELASSHFRPNLQIITGVPSPAQRAPFPNWRVLASAEPIGDRRFPGTFHRRSEGFTGNLPSEIGGLYREPSIGDLRCPRYPVPPPPRGWPHPGSNLKKARKGTWLGMGYRGAGKCLRQDPWGSFLKG